MTRRVAILGGGVTGLAAAYALRKAMPSPERLAITMVDAGRDLGGSLGTERNDGFLVERAADSFLTLKPRGVALVRELGLGDEMQGMSRRKVYSVRGGALEPLPEGLFLLATPRLGPMARTRLLSVPGKLRAAMDLVLPARRATGDESLASFVRRRLGTEVLDRIAEPLVAGIHAGDPERLSMESLMPQFVAHEREHGSVIRGLRASAVPRPPTDPSVPRPFATLRGGMGDLASSMIERTPAVDRRPRTAALRVEPGKEDGFTVHLADDSSVAVDALLLATPAFASAILLDRLAPELAAALRAIPYSSSAVVSLAFPQNACRTLDGSGFVVPRSEGIHLKACTLCSSKFEGRAPPGHVLVRAFYGGAGQESILVQPDEDLVALAVEELGPLLHLRGAPEFTRIHRWPRAHPQYEVGHRARVAAIEAAASKVPGVFLAGSAYRGIGIPDCVEDADRAVRGILEFLRPETAEAEAMA